MIYLKACPRCNGDVKLAVDEYGKLLQCIQCSHAISPAEAGELLMQLKVSAA